MRDNLSKITILLSIIFLSGFSLYPSSALFLPDSVSLPDIQLGERIPNHNFNPEITRTIRNDHDEALDIVKISGNGTALVFDSSNQSLFGPNLNIVISDAPNTIIRELNFINTTLTVVNSSQISIEGNKFANLYFHENVTSIISLEHCPNSSVTNNSIHSIEVIGSINVIQITNSSQSEISNNQISSIYTDITINGYTNAVGILFFESSDLIIQSNTISNLSGDIFYGILGLNSSNGLISQNNITDVLSSSIYQTEAAGIGILNSFNITVSSNKIENLLSFSSYNSSKTYAITVVDSIQTVVTMNFINTIESASLKPDSFGIHVARSNNTSIFQNLVLMISTWSERPGTSYATGIYFRDCYNITIEINLIEQIFAFGRASYGIYGDATTNLAINSNQLDNITSIFTYETYVVAILVRESQQGIVQSNHISILYSYFYGNQESISSSIGIIVDSTSHVSIIANSIFGLTAVSESYSSDSIGLLVSSIDDFDIQNNNISDLLVVSPQPGFAMGISSTALNSGIIIELTVYNLFSNGYTMGLYNALSNQLTLMQINIDINNSGTYTYGIYLFRSHNVYMTQILTLISGISTISVGLRLSLVDNFTITYTDLRSDLRGTSGFMFTRLSEGEIAYNKVLSFQNWILMTNDSKEINCYENLIDGTLIYGCLNPGSEDPILGVDQNPISDIVHNVSTILTYPAYLNLWYAVFVLLPYCKSSYYRKRKMYLFKN